MVALNFSGLTPFKCAVAAAKDDISTVVEVNRAC